jgi:hypothetical protein
MPYWSIPPSSGPSEIRLVKWRVLKIEPDGTRHFVGVSALEGIGRVSSAIKHFDADTGRGETYSGRSYVLVGSSQHDDDAQFVWDQWCLVNEVAEFKDVTSEFCSAVGYDNA